MPHNIPPATLAAGDQSDPAWWLACAEWHEGWAEAALLLTEQERAYNSAAALACRTFAAMMERAAHGPAEAHAGATIEPYWEISDWGNMAWTHLPGFPRSLPAAAVAALTEDA
jgi:hypothetical protein